MLFQFDDKDNFYLVAFYNKNLLFTKYNYEIYDKELLVIICCLKYQQSNFETTKISIEIFINYKNLKHFIINKKFIRRQVR